MTMHLIGANVARGNKRWKQKSSRSPHHPGTLAEQVRVVGSPQNLGQKHTLVILSESEIWQSSYFSKMLVRIPV